ncbi:glycosyltransferase family 4 protein [Paenibacillus thermotolerans]|uniref:glycosyltransferase family 4 protein n=1 Tax=Paenibacillus thermotolerans TaxID=3027807 RepID=UPI002368442A|nr:MULTISPECIES: glycosyltransferase family 4 protein [unclassified Paenibacillus]
MKVLVIVPEQLPVPPIMGGSVESCTHNVFSRMARSERITLISRTHKRLPRSTVLAGGSYRIVRVSGANRRKAYIRAALRAVKGQYFDIVQIENRPTFVPDVRKAFPNSTIVLSLHSLTFMSRLSYRKANEILNQTDGVVTVSSFLSRTMKQTYPKHAHKFKPAKSGVDTEKFRPRTQAYKDQLRQKWGVGGTFNVLYVGRIVPKKGLHTLVSAVAKVKKHAPGARLIAVGASWPGKSQQTPYIRKVRFLSKKLGVPITFTGYIPPAEVHEMYHLGDVFVCPTQFREGLAAVNAEALASGVPVVASRKGGIREVISHGKSGLLVSNCKSPDAFASAILRIMRSKELAGRLSEYGRNAAKQKLSWDSTVGKLKRRYAEWRN